uniref:Uncharacterized protein n=1 Tax=Romanomermis culicivorax TaxID=13658 RepID=A0A915J4W5_ROMCU
MIESILQKLKDIGVTDPDRLRKLAMVSANAHAKCQAVLTISCSRQFVTVSMSMEPSNPVKNEREVDVITIDDEDNKTVPTARLQTARMRRQKVERDYILSSHVLVITPTGAVEEQISNLPGAISASSKPQTTDDPSIPEQAGAGTLADPYIKVLGSSPGPSLTFTEARNNGNRLPQHFMLCV